MFTYLLFIFMIAQHVFYCSSSWLEGSSRLPRQDDSLALGYDVSTDTILIFGGDDNPRQFVTFKNNAFTNMDSSYLTSSQKTNGYGQHYTQLGDDLWMIGSDGQSVTHVHTQSPYQASVPLSIPTTVHEGGCLVSITGFLIIIGGGWVDSNGPESLDKVQIYDINNGQWLSSVPRLPFVIQQAACVAVNGIVYAIGGADYPIYDSILTLDVSNLPTLPSSWNVFPDTLRIPLLGVRCAAYGPYIYVIGGQQDNEISFVSDVHLIDTLAGTCNVIDHLTEALVGVSCIRVNDILYAFGGFSNDIEMVKTYQYTVLPALPTEDPTSSPSPSPTKKPTPIPTKKPTLFPTVRPTARPTNQPTSMPTTKPTPSPTAKPTNKPTPSPTPSPTTRPTPMPTKSPTPSPTAKPTNKPTPLPTPSPTVTPTIRPTSRPTPRPTTEPTPSPTPALTTNPTPRPTQTPVNAPTATERPSKNPSPEPYNNPTRFPTRKSTPSPTEMPSNQPMETPRPSSNLSSSHNPTESPTEHPTHMSTRIPTQTTNIRTSAANKFIGNNEANRDEYIPVIVVGVIVVTMCILAASCFFYFHTQKKRANEAEQIVITVSNQGAIIPATTSIDYDFPTKTHDVTHGAEGLKGKRFNVANILQGSVKMTKKPLGEENVVVKSGKQQQDTKGLKGKRFNVAKILQGSAKMTKKPSEGQDSMNVFNVANVMQMTQNVVVIPNENVHAEGSDSEKDNTSDDSEELYEIVQTPLSDKKEDQRCADCGKQDFGKIYEEDGLFYCNQCWMYYGDQMGKPKSICDSVRIR
eukprot:177324_1